MTKKYSHGKFTVSLKILLTDSHGNHLVLLSRSLNKYWQGKYDFPGGRINDDEIKIDFHKLLNREIKEEIGEQVKYTLRPDPVAMSMCQYLGEEKKLFILFEAFYLKGKIVISHEHLDYRWVKINSKIIKQKFSGVFQDLLYNYLKWNKIRL